MLPREEQVDHLLVNMYDFMTVAETAEVFRVHERTIRRWLASGRIAKAKTHPGRAGRVRIFKDEIRRILLGEVE